MKLSNKKKQAKWLKKAFVLTFLLSGIIITSALAFNFHINQNIVPTTNIAGVSKTIDQSEVYSVTDPNNLESMDHIKKLKKELDQANKLYVEQLEVSEKNIRFDVDGDLITVYATQATLNEVLYSLQDKFKLKIHDYTETFEDHALKKTFFATGTLTTLVNEILKKYGYDNYAVKSSDNIVSVFLLEPPSNFEELAETSKESLVSNIVDTPLNPIQSRLKEQAIPIVNNSNGTQNIASNNSIALAKRELDAKSKVIAFDAEVDFSNGVPAQYQQQFQQLSKSATADVQGLAKALANVEAQLKANQFLNNQ